MSCCRTFGISHHADYVRTVYWLGPILGSLLAAGFYKFVKALEYETTNPNQDAAIEHPVVERLRPVSHSDHAHGDLDAGIVPLPPPPQAHPATTATTFDSEKSNDSRKTDYEREGEGNAMRRPVGRGPSYVA